MEFVVNWYWWNKCDSCQNRNMVWQAVVQWTKNFVNFCSPISLLPQQLKLYASTLIFCYIKHCYLKVPSYIKEYRPRGYETFFMLNSIEHEIFPVHKCKNASNCWLFLHLWAGKIAFSAYLSLKKSWITWYFYIYEHLVEHEKSFITSGPVLSHFQYFNSFYLKPLVSQKWIFWSRKI